MRRWECRRTYPSEAGCNVRYWHLADISTEPPNVRSWGESGHAILHRKCPLMTQSGHLMTRAFTLRSIVCGGISIKGAPGRLFSDLTSQRD